MLTERTSEGSAGHALLDRAVLNLMLDAERPVSPRRRRDRSRAERPRRRSRELAPPRRRKLIHRWNDLAVTAHTAVRYCEITHGHGEHPSDGDERQHEKAVLESLLARARNGDGPRSEEQIFEAHSARKRKQWLQVSDALDRLEAAGLIERRGGRAIASALALRLDELMSV